MHHHPCPLSLSRSLSLSRHDDSSRIGMGRCTTISVLSSQQKNQNNEVDVIGVSCCHWPNVAGLGAMIGCWMAVSYWYGGRHDAGLTGRNTLGSTVWLRHTVLTYSLRCPCSRYGSA